MGKFDTKHKVIFQPSLGKTASNSALELFIKWKNGDMKCDESLYEEITIYHDYDNIKPYQYIDNPGNVIEEQFIDLINIPVDTEYQIYKTHIDQLDDKQWVYDLLDNPPSNFIILVPVRHPYLSLLRKYNDDYFDEGVINMLNRLYSSIDGKNIIPFPTDLLSSLSKNDLQTELSFFFDKYLGIKFKWHDLYDNIFFSRFQKQKNKKSELVMVEEVWNLSKPIIKVLKRFGINYTDDLNNYNRFSFKNLIR
jgi:hypothetical protein|tara:strand:- start:162 stop:914 length:753 start_codon:yes stop_codon:yes gene_type:complete